MGEPIVHGGVRLLPASEAFEPVPHMRWVVVRNERKRSIGLFYGATQQPLRPAHAARASVRQGYLLLSPVAFGCFRLRRHSNQFLICDGSLSEMNGSGP